MTAFLQKVVGILNFLEFEDFVNSVSEPRANKPKAKEPNVQLTKRQGNRAEELGPRDRDTKPSQLHPNNQT